MCRDVLTGIGAMHLKRTTTTGSGLTAAILKIVASPWLAATLAEMIVMLMTVPQKRNHQIVSLLSTILGSVYLGRLVCKYMMIFKWTLSDSRSIPRWPANSHDCKRLLRVHQAPQDHAPDRLRERD